MKRSLGGDDALIRFKTHLFVCFFFYLLLFFWAGFPVFPFYVFGMFFVLLMAWKTKEKQTNSALIFLDTFPPLEYKSTRLAK